MEDGVSFIGKFFEKFLVFSDGNGRGLGQNAGLFYEFKDLKGRNVHAVLVEIVTKRNPQRDDADLILLIKSRGQVTG